MEWDSAHARQSVMEGLHSHLASDLLEIAFPADGTPFENVDQLFSRFRDTDARAVSITGIESVFANDDGRIQTLAALSFRREALASFTLVQIWWIPSVIAEHFVLGVPDLESWFQLRLHLTETPTEEALLQIDSSRNKSTLGEAKALADKFWERFPTAQAHGIPLKRIWVELAQPALEALFGRGLVREGREIQDCFADLTAPFEEDLNEIIKKIGPDLHDGSAGAVALDRKDLENLTAVASFATMLHIQGNSNDARLLQELVLRVRLRVGCREIPPSAG